MMTGPLILILAYLLGAIPFGYLLVQLKTGHDVRAIGQRQHRRHQRAAHHRARCSECVTLLLDIGKGFLAVWLAGRLTGGSARLG